MKTKILVILGRLQTFSIIILQLLGLMFNKNPKLNQVILRTIPTNGMLMAIYTLILMEVHFFLALQFLLKSQKKIDSLDFTKSTGPNGIPVFLLKRFKLFFSNWRSKLVNLCFETSVFPALLKLSKVTPLHKRENKLEFLNYRPISLLSIFSKIYENLIYSRIYSHLVKKELIYSKQFGFRSNHATNHAIISITEHIHNLLDNGQYVCGISVVLEKAFDTVNHTVLREKLNLYGLRGNNNLL